MVMKRFLSITGLSRPITIEGCEEMPPVMAETLRDWRIEEVGLAEGVSPQIRLSPSRKGYKRDSEWLKKPIVFRDPVDAVCDLIVDLVHAYVADHPDLLCLHCAAVEFGGGLVIFPSTYRAGKSTLSVKLASCGGRLYTDDVLPIRKSDHAGMALGILPRLRLPLPQSADRHFREFIDRRRGPVSARYQYVKLKRSEHAPLEETASICGIVVLERGSGEAPALAEADRGHMLKDVILRNFARQNPALDVLECLYAVVANAPCYRLRYETLEEAADLLIDAFGSPESQDRIEIKKIG
jgi:hypothetical protein